MRRVFVATFPDGRRSAVKQPHEDVSGLGVQRDYETLKNTSAALKPPGAGSIRAWEQRAER